MDEPLASLDAARKSEILPYLTRLKTALRLPVIYVTHDLDEVARLADSLVLVEAGRVVGFGPLAEVLPHRSAARAARRRRRAVALPGRGARPGRELTRLEAGGATSGYPC